MMSYQMSKLLHEHSQAIQQHEGAIGFIGLTQFPASSSLAVSAVQLSDLTFMFGIAKVSNFTSTYRYMTDVTCSCIVLKRAGLLVHSSTSSSIAPSNRVR